MFIHFFFQEMATMEVEKTVAVLSERVYSLSIDGGSKRLSKTYPILVYGFDPTQERIVWKMLDVGTLHIEDRATGENIFALLSDAVVSNALSWERCLALSVDNANVMSGDKKGVFGRLCTMQPACHLAGCVCHLLSLTAQVGSAEMNYDVNNLLQDIWHYLDKSNVRQGSLHKIQGESAKKMLRNAPSRWLDLGRHCPKLLSEWDSLKQFFKEEKAAASQKEGSKAVNEEVEAQRRTQKTRLARIEECLNSRECKLVVLFLDYVMTELFDPMNKHFQSAEPLIATARRSLEGFIRKLQSGFVQPAHTRSALPSAVQHSPRSHQKPDSDLLVGDGVQNYLSKLEVEASSEKTEEKRQRKMESVQALKTKFFVTVRGFYMKATAYAKKNLPVASPVLAHAEVADTTQRDAAKFSSIDYFVKRYPAMLPLECKQQDLQREFVEYQELGDSELPPTVLVNSCADARTPDKDPKERMDSRWVTIASLRDEVRAEIPLSASCDAVHPEHSCEPGGGWAAVFCGS